MRNTKTKKMIINALMLGIGAVLHQLTPALGLPMQPDFALAMLFIIIILNDGDYKTSLICGIITGVFTALTTKFPGGQFPNIIDKVVTVHAVLLIIYAMKNLPIIKKMDQMKAKFIECGVILAIGTFVSGITFLLAASILVGLPAPFTALFIAVVIPALAINLIAGLALFKIVETSMKKALA